VCTCLLVCCCECNDSLDQIDSTTTAEMRNKCSPRWIVYPKQGSFGAKHQTGVTTVRQCLQSCVDDQLCVAVEWYKYTRLGRYYRECWLHSSTNQLYSDRKNRPDVTQFEIVRGCETASGTTIFHSLRTVIYTVFQKSSPLGLS